ncbi:MAG TPA: hypothetical protein VK982_06540 [Bacteroidales bacterium]|nr:hypothetical protein [Bacteroidales bacterium]
MKKNRIYTNVQVAMFIKDIFEYDFEKVLTEIDLMFNDDINCKDLENIIDEFTERKERENENEFKF